MTAPELASRDRLRAHLIEVAGRLLASGGAEAVTTRSVALAAGVQAPAIYRLFGDKDGLLGAVAEHGFAAYVGGKRLDPGMDPLDSLREGWDTHVGFGLANPALFRLMMLALPGAGGGSAVQAGVRVLQERVHRIAAAGRLRVRERTAALLIHAAGVGVVLALIDRAEDERDPALAETAWQAVCGAILTEPPDASRAPAVPAAVTLRAALPALPLSGGERVLLGEWLDRVVDG